MSFAKRTNDEILEWRLGNAQPDFQQKRAASYPQCGCPEPEDNPSNGSPCRGSNEIVCPPASGWLERKG